MKFSFTSMFNIFMKVMPVALAFTPEGATKDAIVESAGIAFATVPKVYEAVKNQMDPALPGTVKKQAAMIALQAVSDTADQKLTGGAHNTYAKIMDGLSAAIEAIYEEDKAQSAPPPADNQAATQQG